MSGPDSKQKRDFSRQIEYLRNLEPPNEPAFVLQALLVLGPCFAAFFLAGWWECAVWSVTYIGLLLCEKVMVRRVSASPSSPAYSFVMAVLTIQGSTYCFMPLFLWFQGPDVAKFVALSLITASTMHTMLHRALHPSILLCYLIPDAAVFLIISGSALVMNGATVDAILYLIAGLAICTFFLSMFFQAYQKEVSARQEIENREVAEIAKRTSEARFRVLFDSAPIPIREEDLSGIKEAVDALGLPDETALVSFLNENPDFVRQCADRIVVVDANRASIALHGYSDKNEMLPKVTRDLSPASMDVVRKTILAIYAGQSQLSYEIPVYPSDGEVRQVASAWMVVAGHEKTYRRILLTSIDLTERVKSEERLLKAQKMEAVGQLTGGIAHDFNNLLTVIGGNADLLQEDIIHANDYVEPILNAVLRGSELTQRLLAFSRQQPLAPKNVDLNELIGEMTELLRRTLGEDVGIDLKFDPNLWWAMADPNQIANALLNLGLNARDAMPYGGMLAIECKNLVVEGREYDELRDGEYVVLEVTDTGSGMSADETSRAFEPFFTTKAVGKGSGLGLSMVYGFAKQSNGHAEIDSIIGQGTTVRVLLPRAEAIIDKLEDSAVVPRRPLGQGQRVLVLEDQEDVRTYLVQLLGRMGYQSMPAANAMEARQILDTSNDIRVALCDIMLPGGTSGTDFATQALEDDPNLKVIFISGRPPMAGIGQTDSLKSCVILTKPFDSKRLGDLLFEYFDTQ